MQIGMRESVVLPMIHEDAPDLLNVTSSLRTVCHELRDRNKRYPRKVRNLNCSGSGKQTSA